MLWFETRPLIGRQFTCCIKQVSAEFRLYPSLNNWYQSREANHLVYHRFIHSDWFYAFTIQHRFAIRGNIHATHTHTPYSGAVGLSHGKYDGYRYFYLRFRSVCLRWTDYSKFWHWNCARLEKTPSSSRTHRGTVNVLEFRGTLSRPGPCMVGWEGSCAIHQQLKYDPLMTLNIMQ